MESLPNNSPEDEIAEADTSAQEEDLTTLELANKALDIFKQQHGIHKKIGQLTRAGKTEEAQALSAEDDRLNDIIENIPPVAITIALTQIRKERLKNPERYEKHYAKQREALAENEAKEEQAKKDFLYDRGIREINKNEEKRDAKKSKKDTPEGYDAGIREIKRQRAAGDWPKTQKEIKEYFAVRRAKKIENADNFVDDENSEEDPIREEIVLPPLSAVPSQEIQGAEIPVTPPPPEAQEDEEFETGLSSLSDLKDDIGKMNSIKDLPVLQQNLTTRHEAREMIIKKIHETSSTNIDFMKKLKAMKKEQEDAMQFIGIHMREIELEAKTAAAAKKPAPAALREVKKPAKKAKKFGWFGSKLFGGTRNEDKDAA